MSEPNASTLSSTQIDETVSPETISLSYEELFDNNASEIPCYLPDKTEIVCQTSIHDDTTVEEEANTGSTSTSDSQTSTNNFIDRKEEASVIIENNLPENADALDDNCAPEISSIDSPIETAQVMDQTSQQSEPLKDSKNVSSSESDYDGSDLEEREQVLEPHQLAPNRNHNVTDNSGQTGKRDGNGLFTSESSEISFEPEDYDSEPIPETKHATGGRDENGFTTGYQESSEIVSDSEGQVSNSEIILDEESQSGESNMKKVHRGKQHENEDDGSISWRKHKKHFFILSNAGKPIYSRYGDEHKLAGFSATLQAIISFVDNSGDRVRYVRAGDHQVVFLVKGPIYLVSISSTDEPYYSLKEQLELLYGQLLLILTKSLEKCFLKNANFDMRPLLGGTETVFSSLIRSFSWNPASFLHSYTCLPLSNTARQAAGAALHDVADSDLLFALLLTGAKVISLVGSQKASLHPDDILLLSNFVSSSESFRTTESFSPVCLPHYNPMAFLYAYVSYLDKDTCLILITKNSDSFFHLKESRAKVENFLIETDVLREIGNSVAKGGLRVEDLPGDVLYGALARARRKGNDTDTRSNQSPDSLRAGVGGAAGILHFMYRSVYLEQYVASEFSPPLHKRDSQKRLFRAYERLYASIHGAPAGPHQMQYRRDESHVLLAWSTPDFEFFAAFDPLAEKSSAITVCNRVCQWIRDVENEIFYVGASPFNW